MSSRLRLYLAHLMVLDDPFVAVGQWEASVMGRWPDFPQVAAELQRAPHDDDMMRRMMANTAANGRERNDIDD